jgi:hypothetical protein
MAIAAFSEDIPTSWIDIVIEADKPFAVEPLFTRDPRHISDLQILTGMMVIRGVYEKHQVQSLNHGIGFDTAAISSCSQPTLSRWGCAGRSANTGLSTPIQR